LTSEGLDLALFGQRLRHVRRARGLTLADLGARVGRAPSVLSLLENGRFDQINRWLGKLTTFDLTGIDVAGCESIDQWLAAMNAESPIRISHSSGTTGVMSFLPISKSETAKYGKMFQMRVWKMAGPQSPRAEMIAIQPYFRSGSSTPLLINDDIVKYLLDGDESRMYAAFPGRMSSDVLYLAARIRKARADGTLDRLKIAPALLEKQREYNELLKDMPQRLEAFFEKIIDAHQGARVVLMGTWNILHGMAVAGEARGMRSVFAADSYIRSGGGAKGMIPPASWKADVCRLVGVDQIHMTYAMSEVRAAHDLCEHGHYHLTPTVITFQLDPKTSKVLPREGRVTGRAAFFDLGADHRWGGFISGDEISVDWDTPCPCGRSGAFIFGEIERYSEKDGGDDKISCAASENAHNEAMEFLTNFSA